MKKRETIIKEKEKKKDKSLSKSTGEDEMTAKAKDQGSLSKSTSGVSARSTGRGSKREIPEAHRLAKAGDTDGLLRLISEQGRSTVLTTLDWRGQTALHIAIDQNNVSLTQSIVGLYPDQVKITFWLPVFLLVKLAFVFLCSSREI